MKRRGFLSGASASGLAVAAASSLPRPAIAAGMRELKMVTTWPRDFPGLGTGAQRLADAITALSDGRLVVKFYAANEMVRPSEAFDAVSNGVADMYHAAENYWRGKSRAYNFFAAVPFGLTAAEHAAWIHFGGGQKLWDELSADFNLKPFMAGNTGGQMGGWFTRTVNSLEDFQALKIRMPGLGGEAVRRIEADAVSMPGGRIYPSLQSGAIDGAEWVGPWNDLAFRFYTVAKFYYYPGFHEPGWTLSAAVNLKLWKELDSTDRAVITQAMAAENALSLAEFNARNTEALYTLRVNHQISLRRFPDDILEAAGEAAGLVVRETGTGGNALTKRVFDSFYDFRKKSISWSKFSDQAFGNARLLPFKY